MRRDPQLSAAVRIWAAGYPIPSDLWAKLAARGYDMARLEEAHLKN